MKPTLLQICSYYIGSKLYSELFSVLDERGYAQQVFVPVHTQALIGANQIPDTEQLRLNYSLNFSSLDRFIYWRKVGKIYKDLLSQYPELPKLSHAHSLFINGGVAGKLKTEKGVPYIVEVQNTDINVFFKYFFYLRRQGWNILRDADRIVFYSPAYKNRLIEEMAPTRLRDELRSKSVVIGSGANDFWFEHKGRQKTLSDPRALRLLFMGMIDKNKNVQTSIEACEKLRAQGYPVQYTVIGRMVDHDIGKMLEQRDWIRYIPHSPKEELLEHVRSSDIFIMPSHKETFGLVYVEAMTQGLPVVYSKGQGFDGQFPEGEVGYAVASDSADELADAILRIAADYEALSGRALEASEQFSWASVADRYEELYRSIKKEAIH